MLLTISGFRSNRTGIYKPNQTRPQSPAKVPDTTPLLWAPEPSYLSESIYTTATVSIRSPELPLLRYSHYPKDFSSIRRLTTAADLDLMSNAVGVELKFSSSDLEMFQDSDVATADKNGNECISNESLIENGAEISLEDWALGDNLQAAVANSSELEVNELSSNLLKKSGGDEVKKLKKSKPQKDVAGQKFASVYSRDYSKTKLSQSLSSLSKRDAATGLRSSVPVMKQTTSDAGRTKRSVAAKFDFMDKGVSSQATQSTTSRVTVQGKSISGFSFRLDERAEKRKEFFMKFEEKISAKELEKTNLQEKSKENQEAEIKQLRRSLTFKAAPMPTFYQESGPPKVELKKIPPTRARSPKLGRHKPLGGASNGSSEGTLKSVKQNDGAVNKMATSKLLSRQPSQKPEPSNPKANLAGSRIKAPLESQTVEKSEAEGNKNISKCDAQPIENSPEASEGEGNKNISKCDDQPIENSPEASEGEGNNISKSDAQPIENSPEADAELEWKSSEGTGVSEDHTEEEMVLSSSRPSTPAG